MSKSRLPVIALFVLIVGNSAPAADSVFEPPTRLEADGKVIDTGNAWGHSSPAIFDINGDNLPDLVLGDFSGKFRCYSNTGSAKAPAYKTGELLQAGGKAAEVRIYCCIGAQPRFRDLTGDGIPDLLANSYDPGHAYLFPGLTGNTFAARQEIIDKAGVPVRATPKQQQDHQSYGAFYDAVDFDDDGDLDLLIGCFSGELKVRINEGNAKRAEFAADNIDVKINGGEPLRVKAHLCPVVADWDADGLWDVLAGSDDGSVSFFRNTGRKGAPAFAPAVVLVPPSDGHGYNLPLWNDADVRPGIRSQPEVTDFNGDGKLDLLVGDFYTAYHFKPDLSQSQRAEAKRIIDDGIPAAKAFSAKMDALMKDFAKRYPGEASVTDEAQKEWSKGYRALRESPEAKQMEADEKVFVKKLRPFLAGTRFDGDDDPEGTHDLAKPHGHVWVYIRK